MSSTHISRRVNAPRAIVYRALLDARAIAKWMVPTGMTSHVHAFDAREGGSFRISLTYDEPTGIGKTTAHTDTYHGRFVKLVTNEQFAEVVEFETTDPALRGEMTITISLAGSLTIDGLVERPRMLRFDDLVRYPKTEVTSVHQCCGSPLAPFEPTRRVCNVRWGGVRVADVLADCRPSAAAQYIWSYGADYGEFSGVAVNAYVKDLPIARIDADVLIGYELNGSALAAEHGFPARLVVPGFYGTNSVKWLTRMTLTEGRAPGPFSTRWYNDPVLDGGGHETRRNHAGLVDRARVAHRLADAP